jgi:hypothetical protein
MFSLAVKSGVPLISVHTTDTVNVQMVIEALVGEAVLPAPEKTAMLVQHSSCRVFWTLKHVQCDEATYTNLITHEKCLIVINHPDPGQLAFSVGSLPTPKSLIRHFLEAVLPEDEVDPMLSCFSGLTLKDLGEVARLTMVRDGSLTAKGVLHTRAMLASKTQGIQQVDTTLDVYMPYVPLEDWVELNGPFFMNPPDSRLTPRGVLLNGPPGVGKSQAAKYIANQWNVPAYRLDLTSALGKYVGESEGNFSRILSILDQEQPALVLLDEVEKLFTQATDQGVTFRLLSQLLWWLQEHTSRVFVVMTTNDMDAIPQELYRGRRIDRVFNIEKLSFGSGVTLGLKILQSFKPVITHTENKLLSAAISQYVSTQEDNAISHAHVTQIVYDLIKQHKWLN